MFPIQKKEDCCGCGACVQICPKNCLTMVTDHEGFSYPTLDPSYCVKCHKCEQVCPTRNTPFDTQTHDFYACKNKLLSHRLSSSSGGIFILMCQIVIQNHGIIYGAAYDKDFKVIHHKATTLQECECFKSSKYVESHLGAIYKDVKASLVTGQLVLFSGTPCQIKGLKLFLGKDYPNLLCCDIICHGVPSPLVFEKYKAYLSDTYHAPIASINFKDKSHGWKDYHFHVSFTNQTDYLCSHNTDLYNIGFIKNLYLRPSCHQCAAKNFTSGADITIGDCWGIHRFADFFNDDQGISLAILHTPKGHTFYQSLMPNLETIPAPDDLCTKWNTMLIKSVTPHPNRSSFFNLLHTLPITKAIKDSL